MKHYDDGGWVVLAFAAAVEIAFGWKKGRENERTTPNLNRTQARLT
jgi:hypothetical protein